MAWVEYHLSIRVPIFPKSIPLTSLVISQANYSIGPFPLGNCASGLSSPMLPSMGFGSPFVLGLISISLSILGPTLPSCDG